MLMWLAQQLAVWESAFSVFDYITLRGILSAMTALIVSTLVGPAMIRGLRDMQIGQSVRTDGPQSHLNKAGTPTMGGALIIVAIASGTLLWGDLSSRYLWVALLTTVAFGAIGWVDDYRKVVEKDSRGLPARWKYFWQSMVGLAAVTYLFSSSTQSSELTLYLPFLKDFAFVMGLLFIPWSYLVVVGSSNAVNLTDGLDGLAILPTVMVAAGLGMIAYVTGHVQLAAYLNIAYIAGAGEMVIFCGAIAGAGLGFLWFNTYPAMVFMGDVGALALGAALGIVAIIIRQELVLFIMGGVFVIETLSVIIPVSYTHLTLPTIYSV